MEQNKELKFNSDARLAIKQGIDIVAEAVKTTLGPKGNTVIIGQTLGPHVTKDGVSVAKEIKLKDNFQDIGAQLIKEVATKTLNMVGDGTTTSTILAQAFINKGMELIAGGENPIAVKREIDNISKAVVDYIRSKSIDISSDSELIKNVATISANNDSILGELIADAFSKISLDGVITVEESKNIETSINVIQGMQFDRGYVAPHFVTDNVKNEAILYNPVILITEQRITSMRSVVDVLEPVVKNGDSLLIIAEDYDSEVIENLKLNKLQGVLKVVAIKAPSYGDYRKDILQDIAVLTDGESLTYESNLSLTDYTYEMLGRCEKVIVTKDTTTIIGGKGSQKAIEHRIKQIRTVLQETDSETINAMARQRIAKLAGGVAVVHVGGTTELEMKERKDRVDDAVCATRAAIEEGVVVGGGISLFNAYYDAPTNASETFIHLLNALMEPCIQILRNCGQSEEEISNILQQIFDKDNPNFGYDAKAEEVCNLFERGIVDPTKVVRLSIENAASIAGLVLTTNCVIVPEQLNIITM